MHYTRANAKASSQPSSQKPSVHAAPSKDTPPPKDNLWQAEANSEEGLSKKTHDICKKALSAIADRLDEILEKCNSVSHFKKTITSLVKYMQDAAENDPGTVIQLTLADLKTV